MSILQLDAKSKIKRSTVTLEIPTIGPSADHTDGTWGDLDIYSGEFFVNVPDQRVWIGTGLTVLELTGGGGSAFDLVNDWAPVTIYVLNEEVTFISPTTLVQTLYRRTIAGTSGAAFDATEELDWTVIAADTLNMYTADGTITTAVRTVKLNGDAATDLLHFESLLANKALTIQGDAKTIFNGTATTTGDVQIVGATEPNLFYADVSTDNVGIAIALPLEKLHLDGSFRLTGQIIADNITSGNQLDLVPIQAGYQNISFKFPPTTALFAEMNTLGAGFCFQTGGGRLRLQHAVAGTWLFQTGLSTTGFGFSNDAGQIQHLFTVKGAAAGFTWLNPQQQAGGDFRYSGDNNPYLIFGDASVDSVGINQLTPTAKLHVTGADLLAATLGFLVEDSAGTDSFKVQNDGVTVFRSFTLATLPAVVVDGVIIVTDATPNVTTCVGVGAAWIDTNTGVAVV